MPEQLTPFIGRRREVGEIRDLLASARVLTLVGPGGVGKTRLAIAVAMDRQRAFPDGVWLIELDAIEEAGLLATRVRDTVASRIDVGSASDDPAANLARALGDKHLLLVLDNCEHIVDDVARLVEVIGRQCPKVRILATSRTPLRAAGDVTYQVLPLSMPATQPSPSERETDASDAVRFFVDRARVVVPGFELTADNRHDVYEVVQRLDRLPLALELAAVRLRSLTVRQIAERVASRRTMLDWGSRSAPLRQQTMWSSLRWSWELCTEAERRLWAQMSVFRGTFDLDAVEAICGADVPATEDILDLLQGLVERSILLREDHGPTARYSMLQVIRHFGRENLGARHDDDAMLQARHMSWYFGLIARADAEWNSDRQVKWLRVLPLEHNNILVALAAASESTTHVDAAATAVCGLWRYYWWACGWQSEGVYWAQRCKRLLASPLLRGRLFLVGSLLAWTNGDLSCAATLLDDGRAAAESADDELARGLVEHVQGDAAFYSERHHDAIEHFKRAAVTLGDRFKTHRIDSLLMLTLAQGAVGDVHGAQSTQRAIEMDLDPGERFQRSYAALYLVEGLRIYGSIDQALARAREALSLKSTFHDPFGVAWTLEVLAAIAGDSRQFERAAFLHGAAGRMWKSMSIDSPTLERLQIHGEIAGGHGRPPATQATLTEHRRRGARASLSEAVRYALGEQTDIGGAQVHADALTRREAEIAKLVALGMTNKQIASRLVIAQRTADAHVQNILMKLGFNSRAQIATWVAAEAIARG